MASARYRDPETQPRRIDARESDAKELRLRSVHRDISGNIIGGRDQLTGEKVDVPAAANRSLIPPMSDGFARLRAQPPVTWEERESGHAAAEESARERMIPGIDRMRETASTAGLNTANTASAAAAPVMGGVGSVMGTAAGMGVTAQSMTNQKAAANPYRDVLARRRTQVGLSPTAATTSFQPPKVPGIEEGKLWSANLLRRKQARTY